MASAWFRFYEELNDFLPAAQRKVEFEHRFDRRASIKDMIESLGVPHPEIELILVNGRSVDFSYIVGDGDHVSVYPVFESLDVSSLIRLRPQPLRNPVFIVDCNLGRLARYLRLLGFDCLYRNDYRDAEVATISRQQQRIVLTRDRRLLQYSVDPLLQPKTRRYYDLFRQCPDCKQVYWQGSHHARTLKLIEELIEPPSAVSGRRSPVPCGRGR